MDGRNNGHDGGAVWSVCLACDPNAGSSLRSGIPFRGASNIKVDSDLVLINALDTDPAGRAIAGLDASKCRLSGCSEQANGSGVVKNPEAESHEHKRNNASAVTADWRSDRAMVDQPVRHQQPHQSHCREHAANGGYVVSGSSGEQRGVNADIVATVGDGDRCDGGDVGTPNE